MSANLDRSGNWLSLALEAISCVGYTVVEGVVATSMLAATRSKMYEVQQKIVTEIGQRRLSGAGEIGVLRLMPKYDEFFLRYLALPELLDVVNATVSETAIMHLQNGFILPSYDSSVMPSVFQNCFHQDFPRVLNGYLASINILFAVDDFTAENGATLVVPGTHQQQQAPVAQYCQSAAVPVICPAGSMVVFDSTLWHAAGANTSGHDRLAINHQFTRSYIKQQIDYVRALGEEAVLHQPDRTQQLLGYYTRVVTSLDEYYRPEAERLYRKGQG